MMHLRILPLKRYLTIGMIALVCATGAWAKRPKTQPAAERTQAEVVREQELKYYFYEAMRLMDAQQYGEAMALLMHCEDIAPEDPTVCHYLGVMYGGLGDKERSYRYQEKAYRLCPQENWYGYMVQLFQREENPGEKGAKGGTKYQKQAIKELREVAPQCSEPEQAYETLLEMCMAVGDAKGALEQLEKLAAIRGASEYNTIQRCQLLMNLGQRRKAKQTLDAYLREDPTSDYLQVFWGSVAIQDGDAKTAYEELNKVRKTNPANPYLSLQLANYHGVLADKDSAAFFMMQAIENENIDLDYKLRILYDRRYPWLLEQEEQTLQSLCRQYPLEEGAAAALADYYSKQQDGQKAVPALWTLVDINPHHEYAWSNLLLFYQADTTTTDSAYLHLFRQALKHNPERMQWWYMMALYKINVNDLDSALYYCREGLRQPEETDLRYKVALLITAGDTWMQKEIIDSAAVYYEAALGYDPENAYVLNNYAYSLATHGGDLRKAEKLAARAVKKEPDNASYLDSYAWILYLQGQTMLAAFYIQQAWDKSVKKDDPELVEHYRIITGKQ